MADMDMEIRTLHLDQPGIRAALGDLEADIMEAVWRRPDQQGVTVREVWEELFPQRPIMYTTVMNTMTRLGKKGVLHAEKKDRAFVYRAPLSRDAFVERFVGEAIERLLVNFGGAATGRLRQVKDARLQARLAGLLEDAERRHREDSAD